MSVMPHSPLGGLSGDRGAGGVLGAVVLGVLGAGAGEVVLAGA
ncbi:hypothetical protein SAMN04488074_1375 [Lentzea albidocapillata subsp. violacea]|uniref:Uncharacterized protein n=2 Tax=Lentzea albidocapillata TaxID=40571 RepID=A0A1G9Z2I3_9PSEU|nr:hypothetical protein SAMN04488074_1375 [Lentzea albidocapillata subsp. violacea]